MEGGLLGAQSFGEASCPSAFLPLFPSLGRLETPVGRGPFQGITPVLGSVPGSGAQ